MKTPLGDLPGGPVVNTLLSNVGVHIQSLVQELKSHMPCGQKPERKQQKLYCNKFNKDFKSGPCQKKN